MFKPKTYSARALLSFITESPSFGKSKMERFCDYPKDAWLPESICPYILGLEVLENIALDTHFRLGFYAVRTKIQHVAQRSIAYLCNTLLPNKKFVETKLSLIKTLPHWKVAGKLESGKMRVPLFRRSWIPVGQTLEKRRILAPGAEPRCLFKLRYFSLDLIWHWKPSKKIRKLPWDELRSVRAFKESSAIFVQSLKDEKLSILVLIHGSWMTKEQGMLTLILKGEVSVMLTSSSLPVRTRLFWKWKKKFSSSWNSCFLTSKYK